MRKRSFSQTNFEPLLSTLSVPIMSAPMFLVSGPELARACGRAGIMCGVPTLNARTPEELDAWLSEANLENGSFIPNVIIHKSNPRAQVDLELIAKHRPRYVISALGNPRAVVEVVHKFGGSVLADVSTIGLARKAIAAGVDGLVLVCSGAGGHTGALSAFAFVPAVRQMFDGLIIAGGAISDGAGVRAMQLLGADIASMGTHFIAAQESLASDEYRRMLIQADIEDVLTSAYFTGVPANYLWPSIDAAGIKREELGTPRSNLVFDDEKSRSKAWKDVWSAGQGVGGIKAIESVAIIVRRIKQSYVDSSQAPIGQ